MTGRRTAVVASVLTVLALSACAGNESSSGEPVAAASPTDSASTQPAPGTGATTQPEEAAGTATPSVASTAVEPGTVSIVGFEKKAQAVAVAKFYKQLWKSYQSGEVTPGLARLTTGSALKAFRKNVEDLAKLGHTVAELNAARVVKVAGDEVVVCMSSSSYQRLETRTGAPVNPKVPGFTEYVVELQKSPWRIDAATGTKKPTCRKAPS